MSRTGFEFERRPNKLRLGIQLTVLGSVLTYVGFAVLIEVGEIVLFAVFVGIGITLLVIGGFIAYKEWQHNEQS